MKAKIKASSIVFKNHKGEEVRDLYADVDKGEAYVPNVDPSSLAVAQDYGQQEIESRDFLISKDKTDKIEELKKQWDINAIKARFLERLNTHLTHNEESKQHLVAFLNKNKDH